MFDHHPGCPSLLIPAAWASPENACGHQNGVRPAGVQRSVCFIRNVHVHQGYAAIQFEGRETDGLRFDGERHVVLETIACTPTAQRGNRMSLKSVNSRPNALKSGAKHAPIK